METLTEIFGTSDDHLTVAQMSYRGVVVFFIALVHIRIAGRRSFGIGTPFDNITIILLGAILARAITGSSPFMPIIATATIIVVLHRVIGIAVTKIPWIASIVDGDNIILYRKGHFIPRNMTRALVCEEDIMQGVREATHSEKLDCIDIIYMSRNGKISIIKKHEKS